MDWSSLFTTSFLFDTPPVTAIYYLPFLILFILFIALGALILFLRGEYRAILGRYISFFFVSGFLGLVHLFARYEALPWFSSRIYLVLVFVMIFTWILTLSIITTRSMKKYRKEKAVNERFNKYLPKAKSL